MSSDSRWPTAVDYQTALQVPALCFQSAELKRCTVVTDSLGLPQVATGNVAVVFRVQLADGDVAIRCFTRKGAVETTERRYEALNKHISRYDLPFLTTCTYKPGEMLVGGERYPIVLMPWVEGLQLHQYVAAHVHDASHLMEMAEQWRGVMARLRKARMAHGDLSDGNILVDDEGRFRLIDYDSAYVPALKNTPPNEVGKPNYQHPDRLTQSSGHYGYYAENLDAFASLAVYLSLRAVADDPARWQRYHNGENLIFERHDFERPGETPIWQDLYASADTEVRRLTETLESYCHASIKDLPDLEDAIHGRRPPQRRRAASPRATQQRPPIQHHTTVPPVPAAPERPEPIVHTLPPPKPRRAPLIAGVGAVAVAAAAAVVFWISTGSTSPDRASGGGEAVAEEQMVALDLPVRVVAPELLEGFYTGYVTRRDGTRDAVALTISTPAVFFAQNQARFSFTINSKRYQRDGLGRYDINTGEIDLDNRFHLFPADLEGGGLALISREKRGGNPVIQVTKSTSP